MFLARILKSFSEPGQETKSINRIVYETEPGGAIMCE